MGPPQDERRLTADEQLDFRLSGVEEFKIYRQRRAGLPISDEHERHFAGLWPMELDQLEQMACAHDEQDERVRDEIARHPEGYGWHKTVGGGLPFDWNDAELTRLRPRDWKQARSIRFVRTTRRSVPRQPVVRPREHRPAASRRSSSSSRTSSTDPGSSDLDADSDHPPAPPWRRFVVDHHYLVVALEAVAS